MMKKRTEKFSIQGCLLLIITCHFSPSLLSEVTLDGSMGTASALPGPNYQITENLGQRAGANLFHSFGQFNLNHTESATFSGSLGIQNVISRVTGGQPSNIDGVLRSTIAGANLYFLNPAGLFFGENSSLDVQGSFHASTADYLGFKKSVRFETGVAAVNPVLATATPESFGFLGKNPAGISISGGPKSVLEVPTNSTISFVGGDLTIGNSSLYAPSGHINLLSVGSSGDVILNESGVDTASFTQMANIHVSHNPNIPRVPIESGGTKGDVDVSADSAGKVFIRGGQLVMDNSYIVADTKNGDGGDIDIALAGNLSIRANSIGMYNGAFIRSTTSGNGNTGDLSIRADSIDLYNSAIIGNITFGKGDAGNLSITSNKVDVREGAQILVSTSGLGNSGILSVAANTLSLSGISEISGVSGVSGGIKSLAFGNGDTGDLSITSNKLDVRNGAQIFVGTSGSGNTGDLQIKSNEIVLTNDEIFWAGGSIGIGLTGIFSNVIELKDASKATGSSGNLTVNSHDLLVSNGASITTDNLGLGNSGNLLIDSNNISLTNDLDVGINRGGISAELGFYTSSDSGSLTVKSQNLAVQNGAEISASNFGSGKGGNLVIEVTESILLDGKTMPIKTEHGLRTLSSGITNDVFSTGTVGILTITTKNLQILNGAEISSSTRGFANAGDLEIEVDQLELCNDSEISTITLGARNAGDITIDANKVKLSGKSLIATTTIGAGKGGDLNLKADDLLLNDSILQSGSLFKDIDSSSDYNIARSGDIKIISNGTIRLERGSNILTLTEKANGGNIEIKNGNNLKLSNSNIITSVYSGRGNGGNILVSTPVTALDNSNIIATAAEGQGGNIKISGLLFKSPGSVISASSALGVDGEVNLKPDTDISGSIAVLPGTFINTSNQLSERCAAHPGNNLSSFVVQGRGGIPVEPGELVPSSFFDHTLVEEARLQIQTGEDLPDHHLLNSNNSNVLYSGLEKSGLFPRMGIDCRQ